MDYLYFPSEYRVAPDLHSGSASIIANNLAIDSSERVPVFILDLNEILASVGKVKFLKIDVEGSETNLWNAIERHSDKIEYLAIEVHERLFPGEDLQWLVEARDFIARNKLERYWRLDWP